MRPLKLMALIVLLLLFALAFSAYTILDPVPESVTMVMLGTGLVCLAQLV